MAQTTNIPFFCFSVLAFLNSFPILMANNPKRHRLHMCSNPLWRHALTIPSHSTPRASSPSPWTSWYTLKPLLFLHSAPIFSLFLSSPFFLFLCFMSSHSFNLPIHMTAGKAKDAKGMRKTAPTTGISTLLDRNFRFRFSPLPVRTGWSTLC